MNPLAVSCPWCRAMIGDPCVVPWGSKPYRRAESAHSTRRDRAHPRDLWDKRFHEANGAVLMTGKGLGV